MKAAADSLGYKFNGVNIPANPNGLYTIGYAMFTVPLVKAVQELSKSNDKKDSIINKQDSINKALQAQIDYITAHCCSTGNRTNENGNGGLNPDNDNNGTIMGNGNNNVMGSSNNSINVELSNPDVAVLNPAAPNPFAEQTLITFHIPLKATSAQILFYDSNGKLIKTVDINKKGKGQMYVFANDLSSGTYSYTLVVDGKIIDTKKMIKQ